MHTGTTSINQPRPALQWIFRRLAQRWRPAAAFAIAFHVLQVLIFTPLLAGILRLFLLSWGRASVGNFEIAKFLLSPTGIVTLLCVGSLFLATQYFQITGLIRILASDRLPWWSSLRSSTGIVHRLAQLGLLQLSIYLAMAAPFLAGIGLAYWWYWSGRDLNGLIILRPPEFWKGATIAGLFAGGYLAFAASWFCRWLYSAPILCFEKSQSVRAAMQASAERARGTFLITAGTLVAWVAAQAILSLLVLGLAQWAFLRLLEPADVSLSRASLVGGAVLTTYAALSSALAIFSSVTLAAVILGLYYRVSPQFPETGIVAAEPPLRHARLAAAGIALVTIISLIAGPSLLADLDLKDQVEITAHRAGATHGPENTVAALKLAITDAADWAEIDVQLTKDEQLVVMHDTDLARIGGGPRGVADATLAEIQALDVGTSFDPRFAGEKVPTFAAMLQTARDKICLNVELKPHSTRDALVLAERVVQEIQRANMVDQCRICSQSFESIQRAKQFEPQLPIGLIVATAIGDPTRLKVDFLMVKTNLVKQPFVERAHAANIRVHAWTVNNPAIVANLVDAGTDNIITDDPAAIRAKVTEISALSPVERLLLRVRHSLAP